MSDVFGVCILGAAFVLFFSIGTLMFWYDNWKSIRFIRKAKNATIEDIVKRCKELSANADNKENETFLGDYILSGTAEASLESCYTHTPCVFYRYEEVSDKRDENEVHHGITKGTTKDLKIKAAPFDLTDKSASIHVIPSEDNDTYEASYIGLSTETDFKGHLTYTESIMKPGELTVAGAVYCRNGEPYIEMNRQLKRIVVSSEPIDNESVTVSKSARNYLIATIVLVLVAVALIILGIMKK
ncbi:MAG: hypothetical protein J6A01_09860 [Proteobacteria bacterium]|nr:hypothetical protein [Pseudomonadota bacterium]